VFAVFALQQRRRHVRDGSALLPPPLFRQRSFVVGLVVTLAFFTGISSFFLVLTYHLQYGLGWSVLRTAVATAAWPIGIIATTQIAWRVGKGNGRRWVGLGSLILAGGVTAVIVMIRTSGADLSLPQVVLGGLVMGFGMGFCSPVLTAVVLGDVPPRDSGVGSGVVNAAMQVGAATGIAIVGVIFFWLLSGVDQSDVDTVSSVAGSALYYNVAVFLLTAALSPLLPRDATNTPEATEPEPELPIYEDAR
jgi:MFS family permease